MVKDKKGLTLQLKVLSAELNSKKLYSIHYVDLLLEKKIK